MAKPKSLADLASTATSSSSNTHDTASSSGPRRRLHNITPPRPSSNLLALLATVAASSSAADGRPLSPDSRPPDFLCPFFPPRIAPDRASSSRLALDAEELDEDLYRQSPTPTKARRAGKGVAYVPDKFSEGVDGRWRADHSWTLYGSSYCDCTAGSGEHPETAVPEIDDQVDPTGTPTPSSTTASTTNAMPTNLPPGWTDRSKKDNLAPYILILALVLAVIIAVLIFGCVAWRRKRRNAHRDVEKKQSTPDFLDDESDVDIEEEKRRSRARQRRLWVKASGRWKPNVKLPTRRRRPRASTVSSVADDAVSPSRTEGSVAEASFSTDSLTLEPSPSTAAAASTSLSTAPQPESTVDNGEIPQPEPSEQAADEPSHDHGLPQPPDYRVSRLSTETRLLSSVPAERLVASGTRSLTVGTHDSAQTSAHSGDNHDPHVASAHIATDDKSLLARMAALVSSPPSEDPFPVEDRSHEAATSHGPSVPSVPIIEELEAVIPAELASSERSAQKGPEVEWRNTLSPSSPAAWPSLTVPLPVPTYSREPSPHPPIFPAPPSKAQLAAPNFYEYPSTFEAELAGADAGLHSSAPPFDYEMPSAPPADDADACMDAVPCAPPLIDEEDELQLGLGHGSAPAALSSVEDGRVPSDSAEASSSGIPFSYPLPPLERTTSPPDYLP